MVVGEKGLPHPPQVGINNTDKAQVHYEYTHFMANCQQLALVHSNLHD